MARVVSGLRHLPNWWQLARFLSVGASGFAINIVLYGLLVHAVTEDSLGIDSDASFAVMSFTLAFKTAGRAIVTGTYQH